MKNTPKRIRERRETIMILMSHGYSQSRMAEYLKVSRKTINYDMHFINEMNQKAMFDMAKSSFSTLYVNCNEGMR